MCQPKSKGGKRCLVHSTTSKFVVRVARVKTNADEETIRATLSELAREGKSLPAPAVEDVQNWVEKKRFATQFDPELDAHERRIQLKQLERASEEVAEGVSGGHFHAWKNLVKSVKARIGRPLAVAAVVGSLSFALGGCGVINNNPTPNPTETSQSQAYGDLIVLDTVNTADGSYQQMTISPDDDSMQLNPDVIDASVYEAGFTDEEILAAQRSVVSFTVQEGLDNSAADSAGSFTSWSQNTAPTYILPSQQASLLDPQSGVIFRQDLNNSPDFIHDGTPRLKSAKVTVNSVTGGSDATEGNYLTFSISTVSNYRSTDQAVIASVKKANPSASETEIKEALKPEVTDGKGENVWEVSGNIQYTTIKNSDNWMIAGYQNNFNGGSNLQR